MSTDTSLTSESPTRTSPPANDAPVGDDATKEVRLRLSARRAMTPPPLISVPDWADRYRKLAKEAGSTSGNWRTSTVEVARGPMLAPTEPGVHTVTVMCATQLMKTALLENIFGYFAHLDPAPMLLVQPKEDAAEAFSKERITPLIKATPALRKLVGTGKTRSAEETLLYKSFPGGFLALVGAGSPDNLARRPVRVTLFDEIDKYPVTREGDPITLGEERLATFGANWLSVRACSPTVEGESRIEASYEESDQRLPSVACPHCGHRQFLDFFRHVEWPKDGGHKWREAHIYCEACGTQWSEGNRLAALQTVRWHQTRKFYCCGSTHNPLAIYASAWSEGKPEPLAIAWDWWEGPRWAVYRARCPDCGKWGVDNDHAGFQASKLYSPWGRDKPPAIAKKWLDAKDEERKQAFWNTQMGRPYRPRLTKEVKPDVLMERREMWDAEVPDGVAVLTAGADVQGDRVEIEVVGWGRDEESWSIAYEVLEGDPDSPALWKRVDEYLLRRWRRADGREFAIRAACIDSGGHSTQQVYQFCKARIGRSIWAIKGESARGGQRSPVWPNKRPTRKTKASYRPVIIGVNAAKDKIAERLLKDAPGPGYMHFPHDRDAGYFAQLTAERLVLKVAGGQRYRVWQQIDGRANEALDCRVYAYAALASLMHIGLQLNRTADQVGAAITAAQPEKGQQAADQDEPEAGEDGGADDPPPRTRPDPEQNTSPPETARKKVRRRRVARSSWMNR